MKISPINQSMKKLFLVSLSLISLSLSINILAASPTAPCAIGTFTGISIPSSDPDFAVVTTGFIVTGATPVNSPTLGQYCEVLGNIKTIEPSQVPLNPGDNESTIQLAVRLPSNWNQKFIMYNGGGFDGSITASTFPGFGFTSTASNSPLSATYSPSGGYAITATDGGHVGANTAVRNVDGTQNRAFWLNYAYKSRHLVTVLAKRVINNYYGSYPSFSFQGGVSTGGRSSLIAAALYPNDYDAVIAFAPSWFLTYRYPAVSVRAVHAQFPATCTVATLSTCLASQVILTSGPNNVLPLIHNATMLACDSADGLVDGIISDPDNCRFDPMTDPNLPTCSGSNAPTCLTLAQKNTLKTLYTDTIIPGAGILSPNSGLDIVYPRFMPGYEDDLASNKRAVMFGTASPPPAFPGGIMSHGQIRFPVYNDPELMLVNLNLSTNGLDLINWMTCPGPCSLYDPGATWNSTYTDLSDYKATGGTQGTGGKVLIVHGLADSEDTHLLAVDYFNEVAAKLGGLNNARDFVRLFLVPGRGHGTGTTTAVSGAPANVGLAAGANTGWLKALEDWVATGVAPDSLLGTDSFTPPALPTITRPICAYPFKAVYTGPAGDTAAMKIASNFQCRFYDLKGFFSPVDNLPALNEVKAGQAIPVKFSLGGNWGLNIMASGYPKSEVIACGATVSVNGVDKTATPGGDGLQYDPTSDQYAYVWKTDKSWKDSCRQLVIRLNEGTTVRANFTFK